MKIFMSSLIQKRELKLKIYFRIYKDGVDLEIPSSILFFLHSRLLYIKKNQGILRYHSTMTYFIKLQVC